MSTRPATKPPKGLHKAFVAVRCAQQTLSIVHLPELTPWRCICVMVRIEDALKLLGTEIVKNMLDTARLQREGRVLLAIFAATRYRICTLDPGQHLDVPADVGARQAQLLKVVHDELKGARTQLLSMLKPGRPQRTPEEQAARAEARRQSKKQRRKLLPVKVAEDEGGTLSLETLLAESLRSALRVDRSAFLNVEDWRRKASFIGVELMECPFPMQQKLLPLVRHLSLLLDAARDHPPVAQPVLRAAGELLRLVEPFCWPDRVAESLSAHVMASQLHALRGCALESLNQRADAYLAAGDATRFADKVARLGPLDYPASTAYRVMRVHLEGLWLGARLMIFGDSAARERGAMSMIHGVVEIARMSAPNGDLSLWERHGLDLDVLSTLIVYPGAMCELIVAVGHAMGDVGAALESLHHISSYPIPSPYQSTARSFHCLRQAALLLLCELQYRLGRSTAALAAAQQAEQEAQSLRILLPNVEIIQTWLEEASEQVERMRKVVRDESELEDSD